MQRRGIIQLFAAAAASLCVRQQLPASALFQSFVPASGEGNAALRIAPVSQESAPAEPLLPLFPLRLVLFPRTTLALHIFEERYKEMIHDCLQNQWEFGILLAREEAVKSIGCTAAISQVVRRYSDGRMDILVRGRRRFELFDLNQEKSYFRGKPEFFEDDETEPPAEELRQQAIRLNGRVRKLLELDDPSSEQSSPATNDPQLSFSMMAVLPADLGWKQGLLELRSERERLEQVIRYLRQLADHLERAPDHPAPSGTA